MLHSTVVNHGSTESYIAESIAFAPLTMTGGTSISLTDDGISPGIPLEFNFSFFNNIFTTIYISANGWISFQQPTSIQGGASPVPFPNSQINNPKNVIGLWDDWDPAKGGSINYYLTGTAPFRKFVVNWNNVSHFSCLQGVTYTGQIVLNETSNIIEFFTANKGVCSGWNGGIATQGIQNGTGTVAVTYPSRNGTSFNLFNDAIRFKPNGTQITYSLKWFENGNVISTLDSVKVNPTLNQNYIVEVTYSSSGATFSDTVHVKRDLTTITINGTDVTCSGLDNGTATVVATGSGPYNYSWTTTPPKTSSLISALSPGWYFVNVTNAACSFEDSVEIKEPSPLLLIPSYKSTLCEGAISKASASVTGGTEPYTYNWSTGSSSPELLISNPGSYSIKVTDKNNCWKTETFNVSFVEAPEVDFVTSPSGKLLTNINVDFFGKTTSSNSSIVNWKWVFSDNNEIQSGAKARHTFESEGVFNVTLSVEDNKGCKDSVSKEFEIIGGFIIPNVFTPDGDGQNDLFKIANLELFPNTDLKVFNRWGKIVFEASDYKNNWEGHGVEEGTYFYILKASNGYSSQGFVSIFRSK